MSFMDEFNAYIAGYVRGVYEAETEIIEEACEKAIAQEPWVGVLIVKDQRGKLLSAEPDPSVPVGHIYEVTVPTKEV